MNSIGPNCNKLKKIYDSCFQNWFTNHFLKGETDDSMCREQFEQYKECVRKAMKDQKIDLQQVEQNILNTSEEKKLRKLVRFNIVSMTRRTVVSQGGVKSGNIISPFLPCETGFNQNEFIKVGPSCFIHDKNINLLPGCISNLSIKNGISRRSIVEPGSVTVISVGLPFVDLVKSDLTLPSIRNGEMVDPPKSDTVEKKARKSLIRIRKRKMRRHKYKKLQKKMKYVFARIKMKRKARREKEFLKLISSIVDSGKEYNPEKELEENIKILQWERPETRIRGFLAPKSLVEDYLKEKQIRDEVNRRVEECLKKL